MTVIYWSNIKLDHIVMFMIYSISFLNSNKRTYNKAVGKGLYRWFIFVNTRVPKSRLTTVISAQLKKVYGWL